MNSRLELLQPYPFEKLAQLKAGIKPPAHLSAIALAAGEPQHAAPVFVKEQITASLAGLSKYPATAGALELRQQMATWASRRFRLPAGLLDPEKNVLPVNGTREALFAIAQCVVQASAEALVLMPNPFYQIYEGAAIMAGAQPYFINATSKSSFLPDFDSIPEDVWKRCQLLYICSPGNPTGAVIQIDRLAKLMELATKYGFIIASDECYSEIYFDEGRAPTGLLEAAAEAGNGKFENCIVFHSLSKRSSLPGMRSGFVAGDANIMEKFRLYRTYHGCAMPPPFQDASIKAWQDEQHVKDNRRLYKEKFEKVLSILKPAMDVELPDAGFYLWPATPIDDQVFSRRLFAEYNLTILPGSYLSREAHGENPGANRVRIALVPSVADCVEAATRIRDLVNSLH